MRYLVIVFLVVFGAGFAIACGAEGPPVAPSPTAEDSEEAHEADEGHEQISPQALQGKEVYTNAGCAACHGLDGQGTAAAPGLPAHTEDQVRRQVRAPAGIMPVFPKDKISDSQLDDLFVYIAGLSGSHAHESWADTGAQMQMHHWMALFAIEGGDTHEARHHVEHIIEITEGDHQARMKSVLNDLEADNLHDTAYVVEETHAL